MIGIGKYVYARWDFFAMISALSVVFVFEILGVCTNRYITVTAIVRYVIPKWARAMILGWLAYHFLLQ
jgi:hypothetical protein